MNDVLALLIALPIAIGLYCHFMYMSGRRP